MKSYININQKNKIKTRHFVLINTVIKIDNQSRAGDNCPVFSMYIPGIKDDIIATANPTHTPIGTRSNALIW